MIFRKAFFHRVVFTALFVCASLSAQTRSTAPSDRNLLVDAAPAVSAPAGQGKRVALVIGNGAYKDAPLSNPVNDATGMARALRDSGFDVIERKNINQKDMLGALREFGDRLRAHGAGGVGVFYYAGHGMQIKGRNYLIPVGSSIDREDEVAYSAVDAQAVLDKMEAAGNASNIMILDACRNNPFLRVSRSGSAGLAQMDAPIGTLVAFATSPGAIASDGAGQNGLYTQHLLAAMKEPGVKVEDIFKKVRANVRRDSSGRQVPWEATSLEGDFYFLPAKNAVPPAPAGATQDQAALLESAFWEAVKDSRQSPDLRAYLNRYPAGKFATAARTRLTALEGGPKLDMPAPQIASVAVPGNSPTLPTLPKPQPLATNVLPAGSGFARGDIWRFQTVDKWKGEVTMNWARRVDRIEANGDVVINGGATILDALGRLTYVKTNDGRERKWPGGNPSWFAGIKAGDKQDLAWVIEEVRPTAIGGTARTEQNAVLQAKAVEKVRTPAGEFEALRVEISGRYTTIRSNGERGSGRFTNVYWYVPHLRMYVAAEYEDTDWGGKLNTRVREELTSFQLANQKTALK